MDTSTCDIPDCTSPVQVKSKGWCNKHYRRWLRSGDPLTVAWERGNHAANFWAKVQRGNEGECWTFTGYINPDGYGRFIWPGGQLPHRLSYELAHGAIPSGMDLNHRCHSESDCAAVDKECPHRRCVNPSHLEPIAPADHKAMNKSGSRGTALAAAMSAVTHCPQGHEYDEANTYVDKRGSRNCRTCAREKARVASQTESRREYQRTYMRERMRRVRAAAKQQS